MNSIVLYYEVHTSCNNNKYFLSHDDLYLHILGKGRHTPIVAHRLEMLHAP